LRVHEVEKESKIRNPLFLGDEFYRLRITGKFAFSLRTRSMNWPRDARALLRKLSLSACCLSLAVGCHSFRLDQPLPDKPAAQPAQALAPPSKHSFRVSQFLFLSDFEINHDLPLFHELANLRDQVYKELQLPSADNMVFVYVFEDRDKYERFMHAKYPDLPKRRAFFVAQPRTVGGAEDLIVYTYWGDRIQEDLRHELTHALLHSVLKDVPLWLDEGLAEYFEVPPDWKGVNYPHLNQIRRVGISTFKPDLGRLEQLAQVQQMTPAEYREAWAWVHLMLHDRAEAKAVLTGYLQQLRSNPNPGPLEPRLAAVYPTPEETLVKHLGHVDATSSHGIERASQRVQ
jgi:hypothetical protein